VAPMEEVRARWQHCGRCLRREAGIAESWTHDADEGTLRAQMDLANALVGEKVPMKNDDTFEQSLGSQNE
jgi:hypothetical protein